MLLRRVMPPGAVCRARGQKPTGGNCPPVGSPSELPLLPHFSPVLPPWNRLSAFFSSSTHYYFSVQCNSSLKNTIFFFRHEKMKMVSTRNVSGKVHIRLPTLTEGTLCNRYLRPSSDQETGVTDTYTPPYRDEGKARHYRRRITSREALRLLRECLILGHSNVTVLNKGIRKRVI